MQEHNETRTNDSQTKDEAPIVPDGPDSEIQDAAGRFVPGNSAYLRRDKAAMEERREQRKRAMVLRTAILDLLHDQSATIPMKDLDGVSKRVPITEALAKQLVLSAMKGNGAAIRGLLTVAAEAHDEDQSSDVVIIRVPRGGYNDHQGDTE